MAVAELVMPKLGESIMEATILKWHKKVGDPVKQDETILDIATDKVDSEVPSTAEGVVTEILYNVNDVVPIGTVIARISPANTAAAATPVATAPVPEQQEAIPQETLTPLSMAEEPVTMVDMAQEFHQQPVETIAEEIPYLPQTAEDATNATATLPEKPAAIRFYSPLVLNIANSEGIALSDLEKIPGTGNEGRVTKKDILQFVENRKTGGIQTPAIQPAQPIVQEQKRFATPKTETASVPSLIPTASGKSADPAAVKPSGITEIIEMDRMRKLIARHMVDSVHTSPHVTSFAEADVTHMVQWRQRVKDEFEKREGAKLTFTPMFIECLVNVMKRYPLINSSVDGDKIIVKKDINIGMATALPSGNLIVPVIKAADQLNIVGLSKSVNQLADAARNGKLKPEDTQGGTFTLTNVGTFGSLMGTPIINQPQVAILAVGAIKKKPVVIESKDGDTIGIRHMMYLSLSYDHRIVDGSLGAGFLSEVAKEFEQWDIEKQWFRYL
ncbi:dihydrolipoamide acetyltransferase family protein [Sediminibacterium soli]|uniref:dihydrolipoamide acetyltransferase family protein n=1 Tax=Sediminibacterium soli TaxID=2698829 RepID=UPI00137A6590|nr:dihydrolipoamide acetyltransferase family protein [Sediminibacterium soli]NCI46176.1 2-oxo acid dehydrogenase subunit E2 [Sediminibacterium soli]